MQEFESNLGSRIGKDSVRIYCMQFRSILVLSGNVQLRGTPLVRVKSLLLKEYLGIHVINVGY